MTSCARCKLLLTLALAVILIQCLQGCAVLLPDSAYPAPYPEHLLKKADPWVRQVTYLPSAELQAQCSNDPSNPLRYYGCGSLLTGEIFILADHGPAFEDCVLRHERSHFYDVYVKGTGVAETQSHEGWARPHCYPLRAIAPIGLR